MTTNIGDGHSGNDYRERFDNLGKLVLTNDGFDQLHIALINRRF
jgi:hypothetical protein